MRGVNDEVTAPCKNAGGVGTMVNRYRGADVAEIWHAREAGIVCDRVLSLSGGWLSLTMDAETLWELRKKRDALRTVDDDNNLDNWMG